MTLRPGASPSSQSGSRVIPVKPDESTPRGKKGIVALISSIAYYIFHPIDFFLLCDWISYR